MVVCGPPTGARGDQLRTQEGLPSRGTVGRGRVVLSLHTRVSEHASSSLSRHLSDSGVWAAAQAVEEASVRRVW
jgi:hypothetical protein